MDYVTEAKFAKVLYLADVLEDIESEMRKDWHCRHYVDSIKGLVKDLRDTMNIGDCSVRTFDIKRLETKRKLTDPYMMQGIASGREFEERVERDVQSELLSFIRANKLIRVRKHIDDSNVPTFTASLIVGIERIKAEQAQLTLF